MGYTHYFDGVQMSKELAEFADRAIRESKVKICGPLGTGDPVITKDCIRLNGCKADHEDYESFILPGENLFESFCKTARQPYDKVVTAILIAAIVLKVPGWAQIRSDGDAYDWLEEGGVDLFRLTWMRLGHGLYEESQLMNALQEFLVSRDGDRCSKTQYLLDKFRPKEDPVAADTEATIEIRYHSDELVRLERIEGKKSDWIDLRAAENVTLKQGDFALISLGISVKLPEGYEMIIVPRSSTFKNFGILQTNSMGVVDETYCGDNDIIKFPALAMRDTEIHVNDRICQFRILRHQPEITFVEKEHLGGKDRGGFGSTGKA